MWAGQMTVIYKNVYLCNEEIEKIMQPKVSVIIPVYNAEKYLSDCMKSVLKQKFRDFEVICVDDSSTDHSSDILHFYAQKDKRIQIICQENRGAGSARNMGLSHAKGEYVLFLDADDLFEPTLLAESYNIAIQEQADIVVFDFQRFSEKGERKIIESINRDIAAKLPKVFNYKYVPDCIMNIVNPVPWNKLYRRDFILNNHLTFDEISSSNDITFASVSVASAERIVYLHDCLVKYRIGHAGTISAKKSNQLNNIALAINSSIKQVLALPHADTIKKAVQRYAIQKVEFSFSNYVVSFSDKQVEEFYTFAHDLFRESLFKEVNEDGLVDVNLLSTFYIIRNQDYYSLRKLLQKKVIVSLTSYPARIHTVDQSIECLLNQSHPVDGIVLYLAKEQFPNREKEMPSKLLDYVDKKQLKIRWCDEDLRAHKKYFYAFQEYPDALVITIDDDLLYSKDLVHNLWRSYLAWPNAVSAIRTHHILLDESGAIRPYSEWVMEYDGRVYKLSVQLIATNGAGTLFPCELFPNVTFDKEAIINKCLYADDIWLKVIELIFDIPVVNCQNHMPLRYIPGTQNQTLYQLNGNQGWNDIQLKKLIQWADRCFGEDTIIKNCVRLIMMRPYWLIIIL